jgi:hypothetical protein
LLKLTYIPEDELHGELRAEATHAGFSGKASAWFDADTLRQFVALLHQWPPVLEVPVKLRGGYFSDSTTSSEPVETHIGIAIAQRGSRGRYWVEAELADPDAEILPQSATIRFLAEPAALLRFASEMVSILDSGGTVNLPASGSSAPEVDMVKAIYPIERPYTPLFMTLGEQCSVLIEQMDKEAAELVRVATNYEESAAWQAMSPHEIIAQIDWEHGCINLAWGERNGQAWAEGEPEKATWSPIYSLDIAALKAEALATARPRAWFESYALHILSIAQDYLVEYYRDGPTDDIPYQRHLIYAYGSARTRAPTWVKHILFKYDDQQGRGGVE